MEAIKKFIEYDGFAQYLGIEIIEHGEGTATSKVVLRPYHLNSAGIAHGGAIFALADAAFAVASNSHGQVSLAINVSISYHKAVKEGALYAHAEEIARNPKLATYLIPVTDEDKNVIATFQGTVYRKKDLIKDVLK